MFVANLLWVYWGGVAGFYCVWMRVFVACLLLVCGLCLLCHCCVVVVGVLRVCCGLVVVCVRVRCWLFVGLFWILGLMWVVCGVVVCLLCGCCAVVLCLLWVCCGCVVFLSGLMCVLCVCLRVPCGFGVGLLWVRYWFVVCVCSCFVFVACLFWKFDRGVDGFVVDVDCVCCVFIV